MSYTFIDRKKDYNKLIIILSGYKRAIWDKVFDRLYKYIPNGYDVCIVTSGLQDETLMSIAEKQDWSYLSTSVNNLCLAQNVCIELHSNAEYIFKIDEDMFLTEGTLEKMYEYYHQAVIFSNYVPSAVVPMINVNCSTYVHLLRTSGLLFTFETKFGKAKITNGLHHNSHILKNPDVAKFMWSLINIDDDKLISRYITFEPISTRFSIGLVMFPRTTWEDMGKFPVLLESSKEYERVGLGIDERELCKFAMLKAKPIMLDKRCLVGHLGYGPQSEEMIQFFKDNPQYF